MPFLKALLPYPDGDEDAIVSLKSDTVLHSLSYVEMETYGPDLAP